MRKFPILMVGLLALALVLGASAKSEAALIAYICNDNACAGGDDIIQGDDGTGSDVVAGDGIVDISGLSFNGLTFIGNTSVSKPAAGSAALPQMDISYNATGTGAAVLYASDTDFTGLVSLDMSVDGNSSSNDFGLAAGVFGGSSNSHLDLSNALIAVQTTDASPYSLQGSGSVGAGANPYSLTLAMVIFNNSSGVTTGDFLLTSVPEPASVLLLGLGFLGSAAAARRRMRRV